MNILLIEKDKITRDHIKVGLKCVHGMEVDVGEGFSAINKARQKTYDYIIIGHEEGIQDGVAQVHALREFDRDTDVVLVTTPKQAKLLASEKAKLHIYSTLNRPIEVREFFRLVARMRERVAGKASVAKTS